MVIMAEPNPITMDGMFGIFLGHTFIVTDKGHDAFLLEEPEMFGIVRGFLDGARKARGL